MRPVTAASFADRRALNGEMVAIILRIQKENYLFMRHNIACRHAQNNFLSLILITYGL